MYRGIAPTDVSCDLLVLFLTLHVRLVQLLVGVGQNQLENQLVDCPACSLLGPPAARACLPLLEVRGCYIERDTTTIFWMFTFWDVTVSIDLL